MVGRRIKAVVELGAAPNRVGMKWTRSPPRLCLTDRPRRRRCTRTPMMMPPRAPQRVPGEISQPVTPRRLRSVVTITKHRVAIAHGGALGHRRAARRRVGASFRRGRLPADGAAHGPRPGIDFPSTATVCSGKSGCPYKPEISWSSGSGGSNSTSPAPVAGISTTVSTFNPNAVLPHGHVRQYRRLRLRTLGSITACNTAETTVRPLRLRASNAVTSHLPHGYRL